MRFVICAMALCALMWGGCKSDKQRFEEQLEAARPLPFDPMDKYELSQWWTNGKEMLRLDSNAAYALYDVPNRYRQPIERGRWTQQAFDVLWLEPYNTPEPERKRVAITKVDGVIMVEMSPYKAMRGLQGPPVVMEDRLMGGWEGSLGELRLGSDMRYELDAGEGDAPGGKEVIASGVVVARSGSRYGSWAVNKDQLVLRPDAPGLDSIVLAIVSGKDGVRLSRDGGFMVRVEEDKKR